MASVYVVPRNSSMLVRSQPRPCHLISPRGLGLVSAVRYASGVSTSTHIGMPVYVTSRPGPTVSSLPCTHTASLSQCRVSRPNKVTHAVAWTRSLQSQTAASTRRWRWWWQVRKASTQSTETSRPSEQIQASSSSSSTRSNSNTSDSTATTSTPTPTSTPSSPSAATTPTKDKLKKLIPKLRQPVQHENIYTVPNILTFTRLLAAPAVGYFILHAQPVWALSLFFYAGVTDMVDGYLARKYNAQTVVGTVIDPMADKALMTIAVVTLTMNGTFPLWLSVIILGRDVALAISAIYFRWISLPPPKTMARYWDFSLPSAEVHPTEISKINTFLQLLLVGNAMLLPVLPEALVNAYNLTGIFEGWQYLVAGTTVWSGLSYVSNKDAVKILTTEEIDARAEKRDAERNEAKVEAEADAMSKKP